MVRARLCGFAVAAAMCLVSGSAFAGRSAFGWIFDDEVMPERGVEVQNWVYETNGQPGLPDETSLWWGPVIGITDQLELSLPVEATWTAPDAAGDPATFRITDYGADLRYRFVSPDPVEGGPVMPLVRLVVKRDITERRTAIVEGDFVLGYTNGRVHAVLDAGVTSTLSSDDQYVYLRPGAGISIETIPDLRFGAEVFSYLQVAGGAAGYGEYRWAAVGPNLAWTHGRFWISAAFGIGIYHIETAPRFIWGIAF